MVNIKIVVLLVFLFFLRPTRVIRKFEKMCLQRAEKVPPKKKKSMTKAEILKRVFMAAKQQTQRKTYAPIHVRFTISEFINDMVGVI